jgi:hypothetical protein
MRSFISKDLLYIPYIAYCFISSLFYVNYDSIFHVLIERQTQFLLQQLKFFVINIFADKLFFSNKLFIHCKSF